MFAKPDRNARERMRKREILYLNDTMKNQTNKKKIVRILSMNGALSATSPFQM